jgi:hypothetical protein
VYVNWLGLTSRNRYEFSHVSIQKPRCYDYIRLPVTDAKVIDFHGEQQSGAGVAEGIFIIVHELQVNDNPNTAIEQFGCCGGIGFRTSPQGILGNNAGIHNFQCKRIAAGLGARGRRGTADKQSRGSKREVVDSGKSLHVVPCRCLE